MSWTPTEKCIIETLADGKPHSRAELRTCLGDELGTYFNLNWHISQIRKVLKDRGEDIKCVLVSRGICYCHVRLLHDNLGTD